MLRVAVDGRSGVEQARASRPDLPHPDGWQRSA